MRRQPLVEHRMELGGYDTRVLELEGTGTPIVLLHGYADSADTWRLVLDKLARANRRALAFDLPGFGTAAPLRAGSILDQLDAFARGAVEHAAADGRRVVVAGNSLGGCLALRAGQDAGLPLAGVVPIAPAGLEMPGWFGVIEREPLLRALLASPVPLPEAVLRAAVGQIYRQLAFARPRAASKAVIRAFTDHHRSKDAVVRILDNGRRLLPELTDPYELDRVGVPVLLVWGDRDRMVTHRGAQRVTDAVAETTYELLEGVGHCPQIEAADRVARLLVDFAAAPRRRAA